MTYIEKITSTVINADKYADFMINANKTADSMLTPKTSNIPRINLYFIVGVNQCRRNSTSPCFVYIV